MKINNRPVILFCLILLKVLFSFKEIYAQAPQITSFAPDSGSVGSLVTITGTDLGNTSAFSIGGVSALVISNSGTTLVGMVMPGAVTGLISVTTAGGSATGSMNFIVTTTPFPGMQQGNKLVGGGLVGAGEQGYSVSISADGNTAIVGGYKDNSDQGAVWIYTRIGGFWNQQGSKLVGTGNIGAARQGISVSISADGNTAVAGGFGDNSNQGAAWIWTRTGTLWTQQGVKLVGSGNTGAAQQGTSVSISADGNTVIVGGFADNGNVGAAWVWKRNGGNWTQEGGKLVGSGYVGSSNQGRSVCLSDDGNTAIVGGPNDNFPNGAAWIWIRTGGTWLQQGNKLVGTGGVGIQVQGRSVSISADGNVVIVGGPGDNLNIGAAWVWLRTGGVWLQLGNKLVGSGGIGGQSQGFSVSISADGSTAIVGGSADNGSIGAAWVWKRNGSSWAQQGSKLIGTGNSGISYQGTSVDLSADASTVIIGGRGDNSLQGAAWIFIPLSPPTITTITPDSGAVGTLVTISGTNLINPSSLTIGGVPAIVISNNGTSIVAMAMPGTVTGLVSIATVGGTATSSSGFTVTATPVPGTQQGTKLVGTGNLGAASQGNTVAISADGNTAIVGGPEDNGGQGAAWVYTRTGGTWSQQGSKLVGTGNVGAAYQGYSVAISADGNTAVTGGYNDNNGQGAIWVWTRSGAIWSQQGNKLIGTGNIGAANQGWAVSISADGNTIIAGGNGDNGGMGAVWVWVRSGSLWTQQGTKLVGTGSLGMTLQGSAVSLSADGNTAIVGGYFDDGETGAAWVFSRTGSTWTQQGSKLVGTGSVAPSQQGFSVSLSADGNTAIVGAPYDNGAQGAAWVYTRSGSTWTQQGNKLEGTGNVGVAFQGYAVSLSADGDKAIVGGKDDNGSQGAAWVYSRSGGTWTQLGSKLVGTGNLAAAMGTSVSLSSDGSTAIVGGFNDNSGQGAAWIFVPTPPPIITSLGPTNGAVGTLVTITGNNLNNLSSFSIGGVSAITISNNGTTLIGMVMPGAVTGPVSISTLTGTVNSDSNFTVTSTPYPGAQQGNKLIGTGNVSAASQGVSVAVSADGNTAIVGGYSDNGGIGAVWVYVRAGSTWTQQGNKLVGSGSVGASHQGISSCSLCRWQNGYCWWTI
ncbi:MAG: IPT/TIG domain-containing protein [Bacteroidetes bacterium]|nr:IPT/TIG domain-containing protein [Bacteroidota bacterium]